MAIFAEIRRRNVLKVALLYAVACWLLLWFVRHTSEVLGLPAWGETFLWLAIAIGFPVALLFAWTYELTPSGLKRAVDVDQTQSVVYKTGQKLNAAVAVLLVLGFLSLVGERLLPKFEFLVPGIPQGDAPTSDKAPAEIRSLTLANGLKIIVWPDHDIPNVVMYNYVRAGGRNEYPGITGLSHFFEHMMFLGTEKLEPGEFDRIMEAAGGANNAYTSNDVTVYQDWFPRSALETVFEIEADRFANLETYAEAVEAERQVVYSERRSSVDNNNFFKLYEQMRATAFVAHPYQFPVLGWPSDIESWDENDLTNYYRTYYAPNNRTVVFTGDVTPGEIFELADEHFAPIPAQAPPSAVRTIEPEQHGMRRIVVESDTQTPLLHIVFHAGNATDPDTPALNLLLNILVGGESSRLHRMLVEDEGVAISVGGFQDEGFDPGLVYFYLTLPTGGDPDRVEQRVIEELRRVAVDGVTDAELAKARNIVIADFWRELATIDGKAGALGRYEVFLGDFERLFSVPDDVAKITAASLRDVAARFFRVENMTIGVLQTAEDPRVRR
ncbi:MAG: pitrilysin family protein [Woeseiaceae bacterium]